jgi:dTDP-4-dehydrorhamnose reductase
VKLFVIGGSGLIGSHLLQAAKDRNFQAIGTYRNFALPGLTQLDCGNSSAVEKLIEAERPAAVIHAAGWTWVDGCEDNPQRAFIENAEQPAKIAAICRRKEIQFAYFSTSYVFDGEAGPYHEDDQPNPINVYGKSKLQGEQSILSENPDALILRVICVHGAEAQKKNFAYQVLNAFVSGKTLRIPEDQCGNPTYAGDIARWTIDLIEKNQAGIRHLPGPNPNCTRLEWTEMLIAEFTKLGIERHENFRIEPVLTQELQQRAKRPLKAGIISTRPLASPPTNFTETIRSIVATSQ